MDNLKNIMFWSESYDPNNFVWRTDTLSPGDVKLVVDFLKAGELHNQQRGMAHCRIKGSFMRLGSADRHNGPYNYPDQCWYYIEEYGVWTPELDEVLNYLRASNPKPVLGELIDEWIRNPSQNQAHPVPTEPVIFTNPPPPVREYEVSVEQFNGYQIKNKKTGQIRYLSSLEKIDTRDLNLEIAGVALLQITKGDLTIYATEVNIITPDQFCREQFISTLTEEQKRLLFQVK